MYNISRGGGAGHRSQVTREKIRKAQTGEKSYWFGKHRSKATKEKMSQTLRGIGNPFYGRRHTKATKAKISIANKGRESWIKGRTHSKSTIKKLKAFRGTKHWAFGKPFSVSHKEAISSAIKKWHQRDPKAGFAGRKHTQATRLRMSKSAKAARAIRFNKGKR